MAGLINKSILFVFLFSFLSFGIPTISICYATSDITPYEVENAMEEEEAKNIPTAEHAEPSKPITIKDMALIVVSIFTVIGISSWVLSIKKEANQNYGLNLIFSWNTLFLIIGFILALLPFNKVNVAENGMLLSSLFSLLTYSIFFGISYLRNKKLSDSKFALKFTIIQAVCSIFSFIAVLLFFLNLESRKKGR